MHTEKLNFTRTALLKHIFVSINCGMLFYLNKKIIKLFLELMGLSLMK